MYEFNAADDLLDGRVVLITGASDGIGKAVAAGFAAHGAQVILLGRDQAKLEAAYDEIDQHSPGRSIIHPLDLAKATAPDYEMLMKSVDEQFSQLDGIIHNASLLGSRAPIQFYPEQQWQEVMQVNVNAAFALTRALLPALARSPDARLLFTSSSVGRKGRAYWGAYAVSKFATEGLMQVLAEELEQTSSIRVNSFNPGATRTNMRREAYPAE
ncbi:MAG: YciK family oxidoreductase, partial [Gimesia chilikensis]